MEKRLILFCTVFFVFMQSCMKEEHIFDASPNRNLELPLILKIGNQKACFDAENNTLRFTLSLIKINNYSPLIDFQDFNEVFFNGKQLNNHSKNNLGFIETNKSYLLRIISDNSDKIFSVSFTNLPLVQLTTRDLINDEPKTLARMVLNYPESNLMTFQSYIGIEHRGGTSLSYEKKNFGFSFLEDIFLKTGTKKSVFNLKAKTNWVLDAMYIDKSKLRNKAAFAFWQQFDGINHYTIQTNLVEVFFNNSFQGLYCFNEKMDAELLNLTNESVLYKAVALHDDAVVFSFYNENISENYYWDGWEQKFPEPKHKLQWESLRELRDVVINYNSIEFENSISQIIDIDNFIDYYIFLNTIKANDNTGKNTFFMKKSSSETIKIIPWDLDGVFGLYWDASYVDHLGVLSNRLYERLLEVNPDNFTTKLKNRWLFLRSNIVTNSNIQSIFDENFKLLSNSDVITQENNRWNTNLNIQEEQIYMNSWVEDRLNYLDIYFNEL